MSAAIIETRVGLRRSRISRFRGAYMRIAKAQARAKRVMACHSQFGPAPLWYNSQGMGIVFAGLPHAVG